MAKRKRVGSPLTPAMLQELGVLDDLSVPRGKFNPENEWVNCYRIWTCHGYREKGNECHGFLRIERTRKAATHVLKIARKLVHDAGMMHAVRAEINCQDNTLASPVSWRLESNFTNLTAEKPAATLETAETGRIVKNGNVKISARGGDYTLETSGPLTTDWSLFDAVQRFQNAQAYPESFDLLEGLGVLKTGHSLGSLADVSVNHNGKPLLLSGICQLGRGVLPYEYWIGPNSRLLLATTGSRAYLLDPDAETLASEIINDNRRYYRERRSSRRAN